MITPSVRVREDRAHPMNRYGPEREDEGRL